MSLLCRTSPRPARTITVGVTVRRSRGRRPALAGEIRGRAAEGFPASSGRSPAAVGIRTSHGFAERLRVGPLP